MTDFIFEPAEDEMTDAQYVIPGEDRVSVQVCAYGGRTTYVVNQYFYEILGDEETLCMADHGEFRSLKAAKAKALEIIENL